MDLIEPRVAHWGTFDVDNYGDHLFRPVAEHELGRRLPGLTLDAFSPFGRLHPTSLDATPAVSPLGLPSALRRRAFAVSYDLVLVGGGELIHGNDPLLASVYGVGGAELGELAPSRFFVEGLGPDLERDCPVVWHALGVPTDPDPALRQRVRDALAGRALVSVRDRFSAARLVQAGVTAEIEVVPDPAVLLERVLPAATLARRLEGLRMRGCYPQGPAMVVQGCDLLLPHADAMADALGAWLGRAGWRDVVLAVTGRCRGDDAFADALAARLGGRAGLWRLPAGAGVADIAAAVSGAAVFVGSSLHGAITALAYGRPFVVCNLAGESKLDGFADLTGLERRLVRHPGALGTAIEAALTVAPPAALLPGLRRRVDDHFDRIAVLAETSAARRRAGEKPRPWPLERLDREAVASYTLARSRLAGVSGPGTGRETGLGTTKCTRTENRMSQPSAG